MTPTELDKLLGINEDSISLNDNSDKCIPKSEFDSVSTNDTDYTKNTCISTNKCDDNKYNNNKGEDVMDTMTGITDKFKIGKNKEVKLTFGGTKAVPTKDGYISYEKNGLMNNHNMVIDMEGIFYEIPCNRNTLVKGDLIKVNNEYLFFINQNEYIGLDGVIKQITNTNDVLLGNLGDIVIKITSMFENGNGNMNNIGRLYAIRDMFSKNDKDSNTFEEIFKMQLISGMMQPNNNTNNMQNPFQNIFGNIFGFNQQQYQPQQIETKQEVVSKKKKKRNKKNK